MKASFKNLPVRATLNGEAEAVDLRQAVAEAVYQNAATFEQHKLAHRIAESEEVELADDEAAYIKAVVKNYKFFIQKPILEALGETFE